MQKIKMQKIDLSAEQVSDVVEFVIYTDYTLGDAFSHFNIDAPNVSDKSYNDIYAEIFRCDWCDEWYTVDEDCGENTCFGCATEGKDDEDDELTEDDLIDYGDEQQEMD